MACSGSVLCFSERRRERDRTRLVLSCEKLRADPIEARRPDLRGAAFHKRLSLRGTCGPVLRCQPPSRASLVSPEPGASRLRGPSPGGPRRGSSSLLGSSAGRTCGG